MFSPAIVFRKHLKNQFFFEGKCYFIALLWPYISHIASQSCRRLENEFLVAFISYWISFWFLHEILADSFWKEMSFEKNIPHDLKFSAFSWPESDVYHLSSETDSTYCTVVSFDISFDSKRRFFNFLLPKNVEKTLFQDLSTFPRVVVHIYEQKKTGHRDGN